MTIPKKTPPPEEPPNGPCDGDYSDSFGDPSDEAATQGRGTEASPYRVYRAAQLNILGETSALWGCAFKLESDIDMSDLGEGNLHGVYEPIGAGGPVADAGFTGTLDGDNHTISNYTYSATDDGACCGLFERTQGATIQNLILEDFSIENDGTAWCAALISIVTGEETTLVENVHLQGTNNLVCQAAAGLVALAVDESMLAPTSLVIRQSSVSGDTTISAPSTTGGLLGWGVGEITIESSFVSATIFGNKVTGGLAGAILTSDEDTPEQVTVTKSSASGSITVLGVDIGSGADGIGGLIGYLGCAGNGDSCEVSESYTDTVITNGFSLDSVGGLIGALWSAYPANSTEVSSISVHDVYSLATITATGGGDGWGGGLIGHLFINDVSTAAIEDGYFVGSISAVAGGNGWGGLIGYAQVTGEVATYNLFSVAPVSGAGFTTWTIGFDAGTTRDGIYYDNSQTCQSGGGACTDNYGTGANAAGNDRFKDSAQLPQSNWDWNNIWLDNSGADGYPTLRNAVSE